MFAVLKIWETFEIKTTDVSAGVSAVYGKSSNVTYLITFKEPINTTVLRHQSFVCKLPGDSGQHEALELMEAPEAKPIIRNIDDRIGLITLVIACACSFLGTVVIVIPVSVACVRLRARKKTDICPNTETSREVNSPEIQYENTGVQEKQQKQSESRKPPVPPRRKNKSKGATYHQRPTTIGTAIKDYWTNAHGTSAACEEHDYEAV